MFAAPDVVSRLRILALRRRAPAWVFALVPWLVILSVPGMLAVAVLAAFDRWMLLRRIGREWPRWLDDAWPEMEDSSALLAGASTPVARLQRARIADRARALADGPAGARLVAARVGHGFGWVAASAALALAVWGWQHSPEVAVSMHDQATPPAPKAGEARLALRIEPPTYTGMAGYDSAPRDLQVPFMSRVRWCVTGGDANVPPVELSDGQALPLAQGCAEWQAAESVFWRWKGARYNLRVTPDAAPQVSVHAPRDILTVLDSGASAVRIALAVEDDYRVTRATVHMTLARGSGENVRFSDRELPIPAAADPKRRRLDRGWTLQELGMEPGDELYFFVRASDNAAPPQSTQSPTYTLRLPGPVQEEDVSTALPTLVKPENLRSQRQIIIDTEQLLADMKANPRMPEATIRARSEKIAGDQGVLRRRYGQFLGEESSLFATDDHGGEEGGGGIDVLHDYGHAHDQEENATLFDEATKKVLRRALSAMWDAEKSLRAIEPRTALKPENRALEAIKELQQADRVYLHKTAFAPPPIKEEQRLTGDTADTASYRRAQAEHADAVPAEVRSLLAALSGDGPLPALWSRDANDWIRERIRDDGQRLAAQRAVQDVADGCASCRPALKAWLRAAIGPAQPILQAAPRTETPFERAIREGAVR